MNNNFAKKIINLKNCIEYQGNSIVSMTITTNKDSSLTLFAFDKGQSIASHSAPVDAVVQTIEGKLKLLFRMKNFT